MNNLSHYEPTEADDAERDFIFARMQYEQQPFMVRCKICGSVATDSQMNMEKGGWMLTVRGEWCPNEVIPNTIRRAA